MKKSFLKFTLGVVVLFSMVLQAQVPAPVTDPNLPPPVKLKNINFEKASLPGSQQTWTKVFIDYSCEQKWTDGVYFAYEVLLQDGTNYRLVTGGVRYMNIAKGDSKGVMYLSPRSSARYGTPVAARVSAIFNDSEIDGVEWKAPSGALPKDWSQMNRYSGVLLSAISTPWLVFDYEKYPDVIEVK